MPHAHWKGATLARSDRFELVEGNVYFPPESIDHAHLRPSEHTTVCPWKGTAKYYDVVVNGEVNANAAWFYPETTEAAAHVRGYVAFWKGVTVDR